MKPTDRQSVRRSRMRRHWRGILAGLLAAACLAILAKMFATHEFRETIARGIEQFGANGPRGEIYFVLCLAAAIVLMIPNTPFEIGAGAVFPFGVALLCVFLGETGGSALAFLAARLARRRGRNEKFQIRRREWHAIEIALDQERWKAVMYTRLLPFFPLKLSNYLFGLTRLRGRDFVIGTALGIIPRIATVVYAGRLVGRAALVDEHGTTPHTPLQWGMLAGLLVLAVAGLALLTRIARRALHLADSAEP